MSKSRVPLAAHRLTLAREQLESARVLLAHQQFRDSLSRSYYAMFSAARALLALKSLDTKRHSGVISLFNQHWVKPGQITPLLGQYLMEAKDAREASDYADYFVASAEEAQEQLRRAESFVDAVARLIPPL